MEQIKSFVFADKKKDQNWFRRQFSRQMSQDYDSNDVIAMDYYVMAVAAAASAISSLEEQEPGTSKITSKKEDTTISIQEPRRASKRFSGEICKRYLWQFNSKLLSVIS